MSSLLSDLSRVGETDADALVRSRGLVRVVCSVFRVDDMVTVLLVRCSQEADASPEDVIGKQRLVASVKSNFIVAQGGNKKDTMRALVGCWILQADKPK